MKSILLTVLLFTVGCEAENIRSCGHQCKDNGMAMKSYSQDKGCECTAKP